jgi:hypothetical protein
MSVMPSTGYLRIGFHFERGTKRLVNFNFSHMKVWVSQKNRNFRRFSAPKRDRNPKLAMGAN